LEGVDEQIKQIHEKINKIEEELQSHPSSDGEGEDYEDEKDDYDSDEDIYQQEQTSLPDEIKEYENDEETYPQRDIPSREEIKNDDALTNHKPNVKSKLSFAMFDKDEKNKIYESAQKQPFIKHKNKRSQHILKSHPKFGGSDSSTYNEEFRKSKETPLDQKSNALTVKKPLSKNHHNYKNFNSKISLETPFSTKESSTGTLLNKLILKSSKSKNKKVGRKEMDSMMNIISEILIRTNNNKMRLDTLEGNVELKIDSLINSLSTSMTDSIHQLQDSVKDDISSLYKKQHEIERLNFRLNKKILDKPYKYADAIKESLLISHSSLKQEFSKAYNSLLTRILSLKHSPPSAPTPSFPPETAFKEAKIEGLEEAIEQIKGTVLEEMQAVKKEVTELREEFELVRGEMGEKLRMGMGEVRKKLNDATKEFEGFDREIRRYRQMVDDQCSKGRDRYKGAKSVVRKELDTSLTVTNRDLTDVSNYIDVSINSINQSALPKIISKTRAAKAHSNMSSPKSDLKKLNLKANFEISQTIQAIKNPNSKHFKILKNF
jgi:hypothetical protein